jgi:hypothetical protein
MRLGVAAPTPAIQIIALAGMAINHFLIFVFENIVYDFEKGRQPQS